MSQSLMALIGAAVVGLIMIVACLNVPEGSGRQKMVLSTLLFWGGILYFGHNVLQEVEAERKAQAPKHWEELHNLGTAALARHERDQAEKLLEEAVATAEKEYGPNDLRVATSAFYLASSAVRRDQCARAEPLYRKALAIQEKNLGKNYPDTVQTRQELAEVLRKLNREKEARVLLEQDKTPAKPVRRTKGR
ncbi:MAG TPA: tetratricopeptide repeat protein [Candidatus Obscuribacterales bacterium]